MKKTIITLALVTFLISCGDSNQSSPSTDNVTTGTYDDTDTLQPILDSAARVQDSLISLDTSKYDKRFGKRIQK